MQHQFPQLTNTNNPNERQITYPASPFPARSLTNNPSLFPSNNYEPYELEETSDMSASDKEEFIANDTSKKHMALRASTAPARPLTDIEEFKRSSDFLLLEHTVICAAQLIQRHDNKFDLDSEEGQRACKKFLNQIERLCEIFKVNSIPRDYRNMFSKAYRVLYKEGSLCYLTEILDSAQEGFPYLYVNGERYVFSGEVLEAGNRLFHSFCRFQQVLRDIYNKVCEETCPGTVPQIISELSVALQEFDTDWVEFEHLYVHELMVIEEDARRFITQAIETERELVLIEVKEKAKGRNLHGSDNYNKNREKLVKLIGRINSVANIEGKGRDDLTVEILMTAEGVSRRLSSCKAVKVLTNKIRQAFTNFRLLLRKYDHNIEVVDPQLKNNPELVEVLTNFEASWELGKVYLLNNKRFNQLVFFSNLIDDMSYKYKNFKEQVECADSELFLSLPCLLVLKCLQEEDLGICRYFLPTMFNEDEAIGMVWKRLKRSYRLGQLAASSREEYDDLLEKIIIGESIESGLRTQILNQKFDNLDYSLNKIRNLGMELSRFKPLDWNRFLDVALC